MPIIVPLRKAISCTLLILRECARDSDLPNTVKSSHKHKSAYHNRPQLKDNAVTGYFALFHAELVAVMLDEHVDLFKTARSSKSMRSRAVSLPRVLGFNALFTTPWRAT